MKATITLTTPQLTDQVLKSLTTLIQGHSQLQQHITNHGIWFEHLTTDTIAAFKQGQHPQISTMFTPSSYRLQALDTSIETDRFEFALLQQQSNGDRLIMSMALMKAASEDCLLALSRPTHPMMDKRLFCRASCGSQAAGFAELLASSIR